MITVRLSKRKLKRYEAAEYMCQAYRRAITKPISEVGEADWDLVWHWLTQWMDFAPKRVKYALPPKGKRK